MPRRVFPIPMIEPQETSKVWKERDSSHHPRSFSGIGDVCSWCPQIELYNVNSYTKERTAVGPELLRQYFHSPCVGQHSSHGKESFPPTTCAFCRHLNIGHLINCVLRPRRQSEYHAHLVTIFTNWYCKVDMETICQLCQFMKNFVPANAGLSEIGVQFWEEDMMLQCTIHRTKDEKSFYITREPYEQLDPEVDWNLVRSWPLDDSKEEKKQRFQSTFDDILKVIETFPDMSKKLPAAQTTIIDMRRSQQLSHPHSQNQHVTPAASARPARGKTEMLPAQFRVIDVEKNCIVAPSQPVDYVTLSYMWGHPDKEELRAEKGNIEELEKEGSFARAELPPTIRDAMATCRKLEQRYLWVDRFCIVQDDHDSTLGQINRMDTIYNLSIFTIVALSSPSSQTGLSGISQPRHKRLTMLKWQDFFLTKAFPTLTDIVEKSPWSKRGWTFQEGVCSTNNLFFTEYGVYLWIRDDIKAERCSHQCSSGEILFFRFPDSVQEYSQRQLSDPSDFLRAFTGVLNLQYRDKHYFGAPTWGHDDPPSSGFSGWIQWQPVDWTYSSRTSKDVDVFPSWSWCSADGGVRFNWAFANMAGLEVGSPLALWATPASSDTLQWVCERSSVRRLKAITEESASLETEDSPVDAKEENDSDGPSPILLRVFEPDDHKMAHSHTGSILVYTQCAFLGLEELPYKFPDGRCTFQIQSPHKGCIGGIWLPTFAAKDVRQDIHDLSNTLFEFLALDLIDHAYTVKRITSGIGPLHNPRTANAEEESRQLIRYGLHRSKLDMWRPIPYEDNEVDPFSHGSGLPGYEHVENRPAINVMLIKRCKGTGVASRLGIGQVFKKEWLDQRPKLRTTVLK